MSTDGYSEVFVESYNRTTSVHVFFKYKDLDKCASDKFVDNLRVPNRRQLRYYATTTSSSRSIAIARAGPWVLELICYISPNINILIIM